MSEAITEQATALMRTRLHQVEQEKGRLERAIAALGAPSANGSRATKPPRQRRKRRGGTRADQAVEIIAKEPGISASDIAKVMKIKPNYLYRLLGDLETEGKVKKDGRRYYPGG